LSVTVVSSSLHAQVIAANTITSSQHFILMVG
jgi:hypothetical protein